MLSTPNKKSPLAHKKCGLLDPEFCLTQASWIIDTIPVTEETEYFRVWRFHKESQVPLIKMALEHIKENRLKLESKLRTTLTTNFFTFTQTIKDKPEVVWFKDKVSNGQFHIPIVGKSNIDIDDGTKIKTVSYNDGTFWFLNSKQYMHKVNATNGKERIELYASMSQPDRYVSEKMILVANNEWKNLNKEEGKKDD